MIELYINNQLCDIENPKDFSIAFKRQFLNPAELNTKDAQKSYNIELPATARNNKIFGYVNIEEIEGKFSTVYDNARVYVNSVKVFEGKFRLDEIGARYYKGNLGIPALTTVKDVFGDAVMSDTGEWPIPFKGEDDISTYNNKPNSECIFPLVLYSLLPKKSDSNNNYTPKTDYDDTVILDINNFLPSVNVIQMLRQIFKEAGYRLQGSALSDEKLRKLYVSYKNPSDYKPQWDAKKIEISGNWGKYRNGNQESKVSVNRHLGHSSRPEPSYSNSLNVDIFSSDNKTVNNANLQNGKIVIPNNGLYKIIFKADIEVINENAGSWSVPNLVGSPFEVKVARYNNSEDLTREKLCNSFYIDNQNQIPNNPLDTDVFPKEGQVNFVSIKQSPTFICGLSWGARGGFQFINPMTSVRHNPMSLKGSAIGSSGYVYKNNNPANKFIIDLKNAPVTETRRSSDTKGSGQVACIAYLEKDDKITIVSSSFRESSGGGYWYNHNINFDLSIEPFRMDEDWIKLDNEYNSTEPMDWNDAGNFLFDNINLINFLPTNIKVNDWIEHFCKAFNLILSNESDNIFSLDIKNRTLITRLSNIIDLDKNASVYHKKNQPLGLPYLYDIGFTINEKEEGYIENKTTGGGLFRTGVTDSKNVIEQKSDFSYTWFKNINYKRDNTILEVPVITEHDIWENNSDDYEEMMSKEYCDLSQRFWYLDYVKNIRLRADKNLDIAFVKRESNGIILDYENKADSISKAYFLLLNNKKSYTVINCYLTPEEYNKLPNSLIQFNGDLYHTAEIDGYDPTGRNAATLKLIKKII